MIEVKFGLRSSSVGILDMFAPISSSATDAFGISDESIDD